MEPPLRIEQPERVLPPIAVNEPRVFEGLEKFARQMALHLELAALTAQDVEMPARGQSKSERSTVIGRQGVAREKRQDFAHAQEPTILSSRPLVRHEHAAGTSLSIRR